MGEYYAVTFDGDHLSHHGIHGQKWGIRRFQNPDGTLTEAGKKRYRTTSSNPEDINDLAGIALRKKDVEKSIRLNKKARGKEYSKIANNPENFLGLNKRHANKIDKYTKNIDAGKAEVERILAKVNRKEIDYDVGRAGKTGKQTSYKESMKQLSGKYVERKMINNDEAEASDLPEVRALAKSIVRAEKKDVSSDYRGRAVDELWAKVVKDNPEATDFEYDGKTILSTVLNWAIDKEERDERK